MSDAVTVPSAEDMDNLTFLKHMDARHSNEVRNGPLATAKSDPTDDGWVGPYRAFHERCHDIAVPGQYNHEHLF